MKAAKWGIASTRCVAISAATPRFIFGIADRARRHGGEIVKHDYLLSGINERMNHVSADIAGAGDQYRHAANWLLDGPSFLREARKIAAMLNASMGLGTARGLITLCGRAYNRVHLAKKRNSTSNRRK
jgi:hypothetical protein